MNGERFHILLVDDSPEDRETYRRYLAQEADYGCRITEAESGEEGLRLCRAELPDCVLLDYNLPDLDGLEFLAQLACQYGEQAVPVVMLTGKGNESVAVEALKRGAEDYLIKGMLARDGIRQAVHAAIDKAKLRRQLDTQRRELEHSTAALRESEARYRQLADAMPQIVWAARADGFVDYYNERWYEFTGYARGEAGDPSWQKLLHPDDAVLCTEAWYTAVRTGQPYRIEYRFEDRLSGGYRWFLGRALPVRDESGEVVRWIGTCTDIDDRKRAEEALQDADRKKNHFLAMLAHELRNPLAPIRTALFTMQAASHDGPALQRATQMMARQVTQMVRLIDDLLDVSRVTSGKLEMRKERVELGAILNSTLEVCRNRVEKAGQQLDVKFPAQHVYLNADPVRLTQLFSNLLDNASKFTPAGGRIGLSAERDEAEVVVRVEDNGIGIPHDQLETIFDMFSQVDQTLERAQGGLGVGLTLARQLVEMHGGRIVARSAGLGKGSQFVVRLPVSLEEMEDEPEARAQHRNPSVKHCILIVDDNRDSAETLAMLLTLAGNETHVAYDGAQALAIAESQHPDVILLDIGMPKLNGYDVCRSVREQAWGKRCTIAAMTGWSQDEDRRKSSAAGFDAHLVKPVEPAEVFKLLSSM